MPDHVRSLFGLVLIVALGALFSKNRRAIRWRTVLGGVALQFALGLFVLKTRLGIRIFRSLGDGVTRLIGFSQKGATFVFGRLGDPDGGLGFSLAFQVLPSVIFVGALMGVLYHLGLMQWIVRALAWVMRRTMRVSGAESLACAANVFVGQTEAPLVVGPYLDRMTRSELMALMTGGFATVAGGVLVVYAAMGIDPAHLLAASLMSAPAALVMAKLLVPETEIPQTDGGAEVRLERKSVNLVDAAATGTTDGLKLALNVAAMLIGFLALMHLLNALLGFVGDHVGIVALVQRIDPDFSRLSLSSIFGLVFRPIAYAIGVPWGDAARYGDLIGTQVVLTELVAYQKLVGWLPGAFDPGGFSPRAAMIATYGLCAFANVGSIGIQVGGIGAIASARRHDLARLAVRAMLAGLLAANMTAAVAGALITDEEASYRQARAIAVHHLQKGELDAAEAPLRKVSRRFAGTGWGARAQRAADRVSALRADGWQGRPPSARAARETLDDPR